MFEPRSDCVHHERAGHVAMAEACVGSCGDRVLTMRYLVWQWRHRRPGDGFSSVSQLCWLLAVHLQRRASTHKQRRSGGALYRMATQRDLVVGAYGHRPAPIPALALSPTEAALYSGSTAI